MHIELGWEFGVDALQELLELDHAVTRVQPPMTLPVVMSSAA